jgi:hypothetical protein
LHAMRACSSISISPLCLVFCVLWNISKSNIEVAKHYKKIKIKHNKLLIILKLQLLFVPTFTIHLPPFYCNSWCFPFRLISNTKYFMWFLMSV